MKKTAEELREFYREDYVQHYPERDNGRLTRLMPLIPLAGDDVVLDVACGNGLLLDFVHDKVAEYVGVDFSSEFIEQARARADRLGARNARFACEDVIAYCNRHPDTFTKAFMLDFSEHVYDEDFVTIAKAVRGSLREGGRLYLHTPNRAFVLERLKHAGILHNHPAHVAVRTADHQRRLLEEAGFGDQDVHFIRHYAAPLAPLHALSVLPVVGPLFQARIFIAARRTPGSAA